MNFGDIKELQKSYRQEATDLLTDLNDALLKLEKTPGDDELINRAFRAMHTLKGSGATAGYKRMANFVHHVEEIFDRVRNRELEASSALIDAALSACDCCGTLMELESDDNQTPVPLEQEVLAAIEVYLPKGVAAKGPARQAKAAPAGKSRYKISFTPHRQIFFSGTDPATLIFELGDLGPIEVRCSVAELLECDAFAFDPEQCYLSWEIELETTQPEDAIQDIFKFVDEDCAVVVEQMPSGSLDPAEQHARGLAEAASQCFDALQCGLEQCRTGDDKTGLLTMHRGAQMLLFASRAHEHRQAIQSAEGLMAEIRAAQHDGLLDGGWVRKMNGLIEQAVIVVAAPSAALPEEQAASSESPAIRATDPGGSAGAQSIRVDSSKLDALLRLTGELLVLRGALPSFADRLDGGDSRTLIAADMRAARDKFSRLADDLQNTVMSIRMLPVRQVFQRFPRLVRDITRSLDKNIELHVSGEDTTLDKTVIDSIGDPLTHIIRNAADHGIESKADRLAQGKPDVGRIDLMAYVRGSNVVIEIRDDGKGLDPEKLRKRAIQRKLYPEATILAMDDAAALKIIFAAGFSTVDQVTDLSGRGVGMDVVRTAVESLNGAIQIESVVRKGTTFRIELPASMLVTKGIMVAVSGQQVVLPMDAIRSMVKIPAAAIRTVNGYQMAHVRGVVYPIISLAHSLAYPENDHAPDEVALAIIEAASGPYGLMVDRFVGETDIVIKPLTGVLAQVPEYSGAAIMSDGKSVIVVNTEKLLSISTAAKEAESATAQLV